MLWLAGFTILAIVIWYIEPRIFVYWFHKMVYGVDKNNRFIKEISHHFPQHRQVEAHFDMLLEECMTLIRPGQHIPKAHQVDKYNAIISSDDGPGWRTFYLKVYAGWFEENCVKCPRTYELFKDMDNVTAVMFSIMEPGNRIPPHKGELKGIWRYQLPLLVPSKGKCEITVEDQTIAYVTGRGFLFDDNLTHSVINDTNEYRVVLFLDIQKRSNTLVRILDNFCMRLVYLSPKFKKANVYMT